MTTQAPMRGRTVLVTGASGGIGRATAEALSALGARVGIIGRDRDRTERAAAEIARTTGGTVDVFVADLASQAEVRRAAAEVLSAYPRLEVLVNNVGGYRAQRHVTVDGLEHTFALNHLAPFLLTDLLLERLRASAPARVVTVSSGAQSMGRIDFDDLQGALGYNGQRAYNQSKLANVLFTYELARRLDGSGVTANVLHPGVVRTGFGHEDAGRWMSWMTRLVRPFMKSPQRGAATSVHLASAPELERVTGTYFASSRPKKSSARSYDLDVARRLWETSSRLVGLDSTTPPGKRAS